MREETLKLSEYEAMCFVDILKALRNNDHHADIEYECDVVIEAINRNCNPWHTSDTDGS